MRQGVECVAGSDPYHHANVYPPNIATLPAGEPWLNPVRLLDQIYILDTVMEQREGPNGTTWRKDYL